MLVLLSMRVYVPLHVRKGVYVVVRASCSSKASTVFFGMALPVPGCAMGERVVFAMNAPAPRCQRKLGTAATAASFAWDHVGSTSYSIGSRYT